MTKAFVCLVAWYVCLIGSAVSAHRRDTFWCITLVCVTGIPVAALIARAIKRDPFIGDAGDAFAYYTAPMALMVYLADFIMLMG